jgi:hypothetical protein
VIYREARRYRGTASRAIDLVDASYRINRRVETVDQKASHAIIDQFGHRSPVAGNDWRSAGQRFHHGQAKRLIEIDEVK